eukprot:TRINITY_DN21719_c0_g4_i1.p1 TRINITY_DN21719_c0_g4~~TRINITY_DN21719_c0_g4_i1.p1  ORF type:complete len:1190 (+),score=173.43 TRINITY_DN21719_c0_g4_i1:435-3572(+)
MLAAVGANTSHGGKVAVPAESADAAAGAVTNCVRTQGLAALAGGCCASDIAGGPGSVESRVRYSPEVSYADDDWRSVSESMSEDTLFRGSDREQLVRSKLQEVYGSGACGGDAARHGRGCPPTTPVLAAVEAAAEAAHRDRIVYAGGSVDGRWERDSTWTVSHKGPHSPSQDSMSIWSHGVEDRLSCILVEASHKSPSQETVGSFWCSPSDKRRSGYGEDYVIDDDLPIPLAPKAVEAASGGCVTGDGVILRRPSPAVGAPASPTETHAAGDHRTSTQTSACFGDWVKRFAQKRTELKREKSPKSFLKAGDASLSASASRNELKQDTSPKSCSIAGAGSYPAPISRSLGNLAAPTGDDELHACTPGFNGGVLTYRRPALPLRKGEEAGEETSRRFQRRLRSSSPSAASLVLNPSTSASSVATPTTIGTNGAVAPRAVTRSATISALMAPSRGNCSEGGSGRFAVSSSAHRVQVRPLSVRGGYGDGQQTFGGSARIQTAGMIAREPRRSGRSCSGASAKMGAHTPNRGASPSPVASAKMGAHTPNRGASPSPGGSSCVPPTAGSTPRSSTGLPMVMLRVGSGTTSRSMTAPVGMPISPVNVRLPSPGFHLNGGRGDGGSARYPSPTVVTPPTPVSTRLSPTGFPFSGGEVLSPMRRAAATDSLIVRGGVVPASVNRSHSSGFRGPSPADAAAGGYSGHASHCVGGAGAVVGHGVVSGSVDPSSPMAHGALAVGAAASAAAAAMSSSMTSPCAWRSMSLKAPIGQSSTPTRRQSGGGSPSPLRGSMLSPQPVLLMPSTPTTPRCVAILQGHASTPQLAPQAPSQPFHDAPGSGSHISSSSSASMVLSVGGGSGAVPSAAFAGNSDAGARIDMNSSMRSRTLSNMSGGASLKHSLHSIDSSSLSAASYGPAQDPARSSSPLRHNTAFPATSAKHAPVAQRGNCRQPHIVGSVAASVSAPTLCGGSMTPIRAAGNTVSSYSSFKNVSVAAPTVTPIGASSLTPPRGGGTSRSPSTGAVAAASVCGIRPLTVATPSAPLLTTVRGAAWHA